MRAMQAVAFSRVSGGSGNPLFVPFTLTGLVNHTEDAFGDKQLHHLEVDVEYAQHSC